MTIPEDELLWSTNKWELQHGGLSGRTATQFINHPLGNERRITEKSHSRGISRKSAQKSGVGKFPEIHR